MKTSFKYLLILILVTIPLDMTMKREIIDMGYPSVFNLSDSDVEWVEYTLNKMSLEEKCAQMIIPYAMGREFDEDSNEFERLKKLVTKLKVGGLMFLQGNIENQSKIANRLQELTDTPLLISSDFERGLGMRLEDAVEFPFNMAIAAADDERLTYAVGKVTALEGRAIGVHQNFAPLIDINRDYRNPIINIRAFSEDPALTSKHSIALIEGMHDGGMITTAKHFPGHGATDLDSHNELPVIKQTREELEINDLLPFKESIRGNVKSIMIGHLEVPAFESEKKLPATLSNSIITGLLRRDLKFDGLVITDALNMNAISDNYSNAEAAKLAVLAGNDLLLFPNDDEETLDGLVEAVNDSEIDESRIDYSVRKILAAKKWLGLDRKKLVDTSSIKTILNKDSHWRLARDIAERSVTLVKDETSLIPLDGKKYSKVVCITLGDTKRRNSTEKQFIFEEYLSKRVPKLETVRLSLRSGKKEFKEALAAAKKAELILLPTYVNVRSYQGSIDLDEKYVDLITDIKALNIPFVVMSFGNPYLLSQIDNNTSAYLCAYGQTPASQTAMAQALMGDQSILGKLPVSIPDTDYKLGYGLKRDTRNFNSEKFIDSLYNFTEVDSLMEKAVADSVFPGAVLLFGHNGRVVYNKSFGKFTYAADAKPMTTDAIFDLASVSKVIGTTSAAMLLYDEGKLDLDKPVAEYLPEFGNNGKDSIKVRNLLLHNTGLPAFKAYYKLYDNAKDILADIMNSKLEYETGSKYVYSDLGMITMQKVIEKIARMPMDQFLKKRIFEPLGMNNTMYNPPKELWDRVVPTEVDNYWRMTTVKGKVHDETAYQLGGVAGHAGLFSTASDLSHIAQTYLNGGTYKDKRIFAEKTIDNWTSKQTNQSTRGLGWDTKSPDGYSSAGEAFSVTSFGHTGFTGTSIWVDKEKDLYVILLTNRVYPTRANRKIVYFRPTLHNEIVKSLSYFD